jgi:hypothetical protein
MDTDRSCAQTMEVENTNTDLQKCDSCNRELRSSEEWVCSDDRVICNTCYRSMLSPDRKLYFDS